MKKLIYILGFICIVACNNKDSWDCLQTTGDIIQEVFEVSSFERILVNRDIELIVKEGINHEVVVETGTNLLNDIEVIVVNDQLQLTDNNTCNLVREYGITKIIVTAPNIKEIRTSSQYDVSSDGILNYNELNLLSEDFNAEGSFTMGDFRLFVNSYNLRVISNGISSFYITGETENLRIGFFAGAGRFEGENLIAQHIDVFHRGSNDMIINPQQSLIGELRGTGDLISINLPPIVDVEQFYTGQLIFN